MNPMPIHAAGLALLRALALVALLPLPLAARAQGSVLPAGVIEGGYNLAGKPYLTPANHPFSFAAAVSGSAYDKGGGTPKVQRAGAGTAAVYTSAPTHAAQLLPAALGPADKLTFKTVGDLTQSWATMTSQGVPHVFLWSFGQAKGEAMVSWRTTVQTPATQARVVLVRLVLPPVNVGGGNEQQGFALWRARLRAELQANGFPVWHSDALRFVVDPKIVNDSIFSQKVFLQQLGQPLSFPDNDDDANPDNDSPMDNQSASAKQILYVTLGTWPAGSKIDLGFTLRAQAQIDPVQAGGNDNRCPKQALEYFCPKAALQVNGALGEPPRIYLLQP